MAEIATGMGVPIGVSIEAGLTVHRVPEAVFHRRNGEVDWGSFAPDVYWAHNYRMMRNDDQSIIEAVGGFFSRHFQNAPRTNSLRGLDIGSGGNLYPALGMLPWTRTITLTDVSPASLGWLASAAAGIGADDARGRWVWQPFWREYACYEGYQQVADPRAQLAARHEIRRQDVLQLEPAGWDLGTMFFVAESVTSFPEEFVAAITAFARALVPGAPFAAAFMDSSDGYDVADRRFPAVRSVDVRLVREVFSRFSTDSTVAQVDVPASDPIRDGYAGMIVATGTTAVQ